GAHRATFVRRGRKTVHRCAAPRRRSRRRWRGRPGRAGVLMTVTAAPPRRLVVDLGADGTILDAAWRLAAADPGQDVVLVVPAGAPLTRRRSGRPSTTCARVRTGTSRRRARPCR